MATRNPTLTHMSKMLDAFTDLMEWPDHVCALELLTGLMAKPEDERTDRDRNAIRFLEAYNAAWDSAEDDAVRIASLRSDLIAVQTVPEAEPGRIVIKAVDHMGNIGFIKIARNRVHTVTAGGISVALSYAGIQHQHNAEAEMALEVCRSGAEALEVCRQFAQGNATFEVWPN